MGSIRVAKLITHIALVFCISAIVPIRVDVALLLDSSTSITTTYFDEMKKLCKDFVNMSDIGHVRIGIIAFNESAEIKLPLSNSTTAIMQAIDSLSYKGGNTNIADALKKMTTGLFNPKNDKNDRLSNVCIMFTDGKKSNKDVDQVQNEVKHSRTAGIQIFAVLLGSSSAEEELKTIVSEPPIITKDEFSRKLNKFDQFICSVTKQSLVAGNFSSGDSSSSSQTTPLMKTSSTSVHEIKKELTLEKKNLSSYKRLRTSANDPRFSSACIGCLGIVVLCLVFGFFVLLDFLPTNSNDSKIQSR